MTEQDADGGDQAHRPEDRRDPGHTPLLEERYGTEVPLKSRTMDELSTSKVMWGGAGLGGLLGFGLVAVPSLLADARGPTAIFLVIGAVFAAMVGAMVGGLGCAPMAGLLLPNVRLGPVIAWSLVGPVVAMVVAAHFRPDSAYFVAPVIGFVVAILVLRLLTGRGLPTGGRRALVLVTLLAVAGIANARRVSERLRVAGILGLDRLPAHTRIIDCIDVDMFQDFSVTCNLEAAPASMAKLLGGRPYVQHGNELRWQHPTSPGGPFLILTVDREHGKVKLHYYNL